MKIYFNGRFTEKDTVNAIFEPGFLFGWGAFEALRTYSKKIPFLPEHVQRLNNSLDLLGINKIDVDFRKIIEEALIKNNLDNAYVRITVYKKRSGVGIIVYTARSGYYPESIYKKGFSAVVSQNRIDTASLSFKIKSLSYLEKRLCWHKAQEAKKDESLILNLDGVLTGGSRSNLFLIKNNQAFVPSSECGVFDGITKKIVNRILKDIDIEIIEKKLTLDDLCMADEVFLTSALLEVMPLVEVQGRKISIGKPGEITLKTLLLYRQKVNG